MSKQEEAQKLLDEYVNFTLNWNGESIGGGKENEALKRNRCQYSPNFRTRTCCPEHITAGRKFRELKERFQIIWPDGFKKDFPHSYGQTGFFQKFVKAFNLTVNPNRIGLIWVPRGPWAGHVTPAEHWNTPNRAPKHPTD